MKILITVTIIDFITGICKAIINKELDSSTGRNGFIKKMCMLLIVVAFRFALPDFNEFVMCYYLFNELLSILENGVGMGLPIPSQLKEVLSKWNGKK